MGMQTRRIHPAGRAPHSRGLRAALHALLLASERIAVGGQAVMEGVMMRSPHSLAIVCRTGAGELVVKEQPWRSLWERLRFLRWPLLRGAVVLVESLVNGMSALSFSARVQSEDEGAGQEGSAPKGPQADSGASEESTASFAGVIAVSVLFALALFVGLPHLVTALLGFSAASLEFHLVDGAIKATIFIAYLAGIGLMPDIRRVFMYHGAEHKAIFTYERGREMTVEQARIQSRFHPRCGTSFLFIVILVSILIFAVTLRFPLVDNRLLDNLLKVFIKVPLMLPVAGVSYELLKLSARFERNPIVRIFTAPGLWLQRLTTREPTDDQLEVALISIEKTLWREAQAEPEAALASEEVEVFASFDAARTAIG